MSPQDPPTVTRPGTLHCLAPALRAAFAATDLAEAARALTSAARESCSADWAAVALLDGSGACVVAHGQGEAGDPAELPRRIRLLESLPLWRQVALGRDAAGAAASPPSLRTAGGAPDAAALSVAVSDPEGRLQGVIAAFKATGAAVAPEDRASLEALSVFASLLAAQVRPRAPLARDGAPASPTGPGAAGSSASGFTPSHDLDQLVEARQRAEASNQAKTKFFTELSHELRTPMNSILGYTEILLEMHRDDPDSRELLGLIEESGKHLLALVGGVLDLAKIEARGKERQDSLCSPVLLVGSVVSSLLPLAQQKRVSLVDGCETPVPDRVLTDPLYFKQILFNLVGNALKFTDKGQVSVMLRFHRDARAGHETAGAVLVKVQDTGIGIPGVKLGQLFQPFSQLHGDSSRYRGAGLGLCIAKGLAQALGGDITVESTPGEGACFTLEVPCQVPDDSAFAVRTPSVVLRKSIRMRRSPEGSLAANVALVTGLPADHDLVRRQLTSLGCRILEVSDLQKLGELQATTRCDLAIVDLAGCGVDTQGALAQLRVAGFPAPVIALGSTALHDPGKPPVETGFHAFLPGPISRTDLARSILAVLQRRPEAEPCHEVPT